MSPLGFLIDIGFPPCSAVLLSTQTPKCHKLIRSGSLLLGTPGCLAPQGSPCSNTTEVRLNCRGRREGAVVEKKMDAYHKLIQFAIRQQRASRLPIPGAALTRGKVKLQTFPPHPKQRSHLLQPQLGNNQQHFWYESGAPGSQSRCLMKSRSQSERCCCALRVQVE